MNVLFQQLFPVLPEIFLALAGLWLLVTGLYFKSNSAQTINLFVVIAMVAAIITVVSGSWLKQGVWENLLVTNDYTQFVKCLILTASILVLVISSGWLKDNPKASAGKCFEYPILVLFSTIGMLLLNSANDLLIFYISIELMSLPLYLLATIDRDSLRATEAGIKYFVLGSLASGMMLFGMSLVYGFTGTTGFESLAASFMGNSAGHILPGTMIGLILIMTGLFFKISAAPFHMWTPDVYEGVPTPTTAFFAAAPKLAAIAFLARFLMHTFGMVGEIWQQVVICVSILTMFVGALGALWQTNIKRLLAYSSIGHVGYLLVGIATGSVAGIKGILIYLALYIFMTIGSFAIVLTMKRQGEAVEEISELGGLSKTHPCMAFALSVFLFSMAGIPPLAGFFGKFYVFLAALQSGLVALAVIGVLSSVVACYYYIKIVKIMYFDEAHAPFDRNVPMSLKLVITVCVIVTLLYILVPAPLIGIAERAAESVIM